MAQRRPATSAPDRALLFDGDCGICTWLAQRAERMDRRCAVMPYQDLDPIQLQPFGIDAADCAERLYLLEPWGRDEAAPAQFAAAKPASPGTGEFGPSGAGRSSSASSVDTSPTRRLHARGGAFAVNAFLLRCRFWAILPIVIYLLPPLLLLEIVAYRWVARNRSWISRRLGLEACRWGGE